MESSPWTSGDTSLFVGGSSKTADFMLSFEMFYLLIYFCHVFLFTSLVLSVLR